MAEVGRRDVINDPLAAPQSPVARDLSMQGVRNPGQDGGQDAVYRNSMDAMDALGQLGASIDGVIKAKSDDWVSEGKLKYMQGASEAEIAASGNKYTMQGWQSLNAADKANRWYADELVSITNGGRTMDPNAYNKLLMEKRAVALNDLPADPAIRKLYVAAFDDLGPRLAAEQVSAHNAWNEQQSDLNFGSLLSSGSYTNADAPRVMPGTAALALSPGVVRQTVAYNDTDVDVLVRTMLGEAAGEGPTGLAAVAHVLINRSLDGGYGGKTLTAVAKAEKQFSAWNTGAGGNNPAKWDVNSKAYQNAQQIALEVLSGHNVDPTNGATHYYSPAGMKKLVADGSQSNLIPNWLDSEVAKSGGVVRIGGHVFAGRANNLGVGPDVSGKPVIGSDGTPVLIPLDPSNPLGLAGNGDVQADPMAAPNTVAAAQGIPTSETPSPAQTQTQDLIRGYNMPPEKKATMVAQEIVTQLNAGSTQLWDNVGGIAFMNELGATPQQVRLVQNAYDQYKKDQANKFDMERSTWEAQLTAKVSSGELTLEAAQAEVQAAYDGGSLTDTGADSLIQRVVAAETQKGKDPNLDPGLQRQLATLYQNIRNDPDTFTAEYGQSQIELLATEYDMPKEQLQKLITEAWSTEEQARNSLTTATATAAKKKAEDDAKKNQVATTIASGYGLGQLTGSIDGVSMQQYGVGLRKQELYAQAQEAAKAYAPSFGGDMELATRKAAAEADKILWAELYKHGSVVDEDLQGSMTAASSGTIVMADGKVDPMAIEALDTYMRMSSNPDIGAGYAAKYFTNDDGRNTIMNAARFYSGGFDLATSLRKAQEFMSNGLSTPPDISTTDRFRGNLNAAVRDNFSTLMGADWFMDPTSITKGDRAYAEAHPDQLRSAVAARAWAYYAAEPQNDPSVIMKKAAQDVMNDSAIVGGNILTPVQSGGTPIKVQMGLEQYDADTPNQAITEWIKEFADDQVASYKGGSDPTGWGKAWSERSQNYASYGMGLAGTRVPGAGGLYAMNQDNLPDAPPFYATWDQYSGQLVVQLWDTPERKSTLDYSVAKPMQLDLVEIGKWYKDKHEVQKANGLQEVWKQLWGGPSAYPGNPDNQK